MKKIFIIYENDEWTEPLIAENLCDLSGMKAIVDFLKRELERLD